MPTVNFTANLARHVSCPSAEVQGASVAEALAEVFRLNPRLRSYVVDEHGTLRKHMNVFVDGQQVRDRERLADALAAESEIYVMQALSGG